MPMGPTRTTASADVDRVLDDIEPERRAQVLHRLERTDRVQEHAESRETQRQHRQCLRGRGRRGGVARVVAEQHCDERLGEYELTGRSRQHDGEDAAQPARPPSAESRRVVPRPARGEIRA